MNVVKVKYRVSISHNYSTNSTYYIVEYKKCRWFSSWEYVSHSVQLCLKEAMALKVLLQNGHPSLDFMTPSSRCEQLNLPIQ